MSASRLIIIDQLYLVLRQTDASVDEIWTVQECRPAHGASFVDANPVGSQQITVMSVDNNIVAVTVKNTKRTRDLHQTTSLHLDPRSMFL